MKKLIDSIVERNFVDADSIISETVELIMARKLVEAKKMCAAKMSEQGLDKSSWNLQQRGLVEDDIEEAINPEERTDGPVTKIPVKGDMEQYPTRDLKSDKIKEAYLPSVNYQGGSNSPSNYNSSVYTRNTKNVFSPGTETLADRSKITNNGTTQDYTNKTSVRPNQTVSSGSSVFTATREAVIPSVPGNTNPLTQVPAIRTPTHMSNNPNDPLTNLDPVGQQQQARLTRNATVAMEKGFSSRYMPSDPNFEVRAAAPSPNISGKLQMHEEEEEQLDEARIRMIKARIRGGKIQRRKKVSNVPGMTLRGGKLQRMSAAERRRRKMGARKAVRKRAPKMSRTLMKRKRSLMKRRSLGL